MKTQDDLDARVDFLIKFSKGTMPIGLLAADKEEAARAVAVIAKKRGGKILKVYIQQDGVDIEFKTDAAPP